MYIIYMSLSSEFSAPTTKPHSFLISNVHVAEKKERKSKIFFSPWSQPEETVLKIFSSVHCKKKKSLRKLRRYNRKMINDSGIQEIVTDDIELKRKN